MSEMDDNVLKEDITRALRITQLDSNLFDTEIYNLLRSQTWRVFRYIRVSFIHSIKPEINAAIKLLLWFFSVYRKGSSPGQTIFHSRYAAVADKGWRRPSQKTKILLGVLLIGSSWLKERWEDGAQLFGKFLVKEQVDKTARGLTVILELASLLNFIVFLQTGLYSNLFERLLGITHVFDEKQRIRKVDYEYMNRELLWHGFAEFIFFFIPLINFHKLKNAIKRISSSSAATLQTPGPRAEESKCCVCNHRPTNAQISQCGHLFCYFCVQANLVADDSFECPLCRSPLLDAVIPYIEELEQ